MAVRLLTWNVRATLKRLHRLRIDVAYPGAGGGAGEFEHLGARPLRRVEPVVPQPLQLARRRRNRRSLNLRRFGKRERLEARRRRVSEAAFTFANITPQSIH